MAKTTIEFGEGAALALDQLAADFGTTKANVLRNALGLYVFVVNQLSEEKGSQLGIVGRMNRVLKLIVVPGFMTPPSKERERDDPAVRDNRKKITAPPVGQRTAQG